METSRNSERYIDWCDRKRWTIIATWAVILLGGVMLARRLELRTSFAELLPDDDPGVKALERTQQRMGDISLLLIGIGSSDRDANLRCAARLTDALNQLPKSICEQAAYHVRDLRAFFETHRWLYLGEQDIEDIHDQVKSEVARRKNPLLVSLDTRPGFGLLAEADGSGKGHQEFRSLRGQRSADAACADGRNPQRGSGYRVEGRTVHAARAEHRALGSSGWRASGLHE